MDAVLNLLGLARRAGRVTVGEETTAAAVRAGEARLVVLASDAAERLVRRADHFGLPTLRLSADKLTLGGALGKSTCAIAAVTDPGLAASVAERYGTPEADTIAEALRCEAKELREREKRPRGGQRSPGRRKQN